MGYIRKTATGKADPPELDQNIQEQRQRITEHLIRALQKAGYSLAGNHLEDSGVTRTLRRDN